MHKILNIIHNDNTHNESSKKIQFNQNNFLYICPYKTVIEQKTWWNFLDYILLFITLR